MADFEAIGDMMYKGTMLPPQPVTSFLATAASNGYQHPACPVACTLTCKVEGNNPWCGCTDTLGRPCNQ